jgi:hypothetical protein
MMPYRKNIFVNIFPKKVGERGGGMGGVGERRKIFFPDIKKKKPKKNFFG